MDAAGVNEADGSKLSNVITSRSFGVSPSFEVPFEIEETPWHQLRCAHQQNWASYIHRNLLSRLDVYDQLGRVSRFELALNEDVNAAAAEILGFFSILEMQLHTPSGHFMAFLKGVRSERARLGSEPLLEMKQFTAPSAHHLAWRVCGQLGNLRQRIIAQNDARPRARSCMAEALYYEWFASMNTNSGMLRREMAWEYRQLLHQLELGSNTPASSRTSPASPPHESQVSIPQDATTAASIANPEPVGPFRFSLNERTFQIQYGEATVLPPRLKGWAYVAQLLQQPHTWIDAMNLESPSAKDRATSTGADPLMDEQAMQEAKREIRDLDDELQGAKRHNDEAAADRITAEMDDIIKFVSAAQGKRRGVRYFEDACERSRQRVTRAIKYALEQIEDESPELFRHLDQSIRTGGQLCYAPADPIVWDISFVRSAVAAETKVRSFRSAVTMS